MTWGILWNEISEMPNPFNKLESCMIFKFKALGLSFLKIQPKALWSVQDLKFRSFMDPETISARPKSYKRSSIRLSPNRRKPYKPKPLGSRNPRPWTQAKTLKP